MGDKVTSEPNKWLSTEWNKISQHRGKRQSEGQLPRHTSKSGSSTTEGGRGHLLNTRYRLKLSNHVPLVPTQRHRIISNCWLCGLGNSWEWAGESCGPHTASTSLESTKLWMNMGSQWNSGYGQSMCKWTSVTDSSPGGPVSRDRRKWYGKDTDLLTALSEKSETPLFHIYSI